MFRIMAFIVLWVPFLAWADENANLADLKALSGTWIAVGGEAMGNEIPKDQLPFQWTFEVTGKAVFANRKKGDESPFSFTIDASRKPKSVDVTYEGTMEAFKGLKQFGIYKIENGMLSLCLTMPGATEKDRPTTFSTKDAKVLLMRFERAKASN